MCAISEKHLASWTKTIQEWVIILNRYNSEPKHQNNRWTSKWKSIRICMRSVVFCQRIDILYSSHIQILGPEGAFSLQVMGNFDYIWLMQLFVMPNLRQTVVNCHRKCVEQNWSHTCGMVLQENRSCLAWLWIWTPATFLAKHLNSKIPKNC